MKAVDLINKLREEQGVSIAEVNRRLGDVSYTSTRTTISDYRITNDLSIGNLVKMAHALGYKVVVVPKAEADKEMMVSNED